MARALLPSLFLLLLAAPPAAALHGGPTIEEGTPLLLDVGHSGTITSLALSPDGTVLASSSRDATVRLFDAATGHLRAVIPLGFFDLQPIGEVFSVAFSPDGSRLATGSTYNTAAIWDARTTELLGNFHDNRTWVTGVAFSPDGRLLASCDSEAGVVVRDLARGAVAAKLRFMGAHQVFWRPDSRALAVAGQGRFSVFEASAWETPDAGPSPAGVATFSTGMIGSGAIVDVAWNRAGGEVIFGPGPTRGDLHVSDLHGGGAREIAAHGYATTFAFNRDGNRLAIGAIDGAIEVRDAGLEKTIARFQIGKARVTSLAWSRDGARLFAGDERGEISFWSLAKGERTIDIAPQAHGLSRVAWGPNQRLATQRALWDLARGTLVAAIDPIVWSVSWCGDVLVTLSEDGWGWRNGTTGAVIARAPRSSRASEAICSPDGRQALAFGDQLEVVDTESHTGRKLQERHIFSAVWVAADRVALGSDQGVEIWRLTRDRFVREQRRPGWAQKLAWRRDGSIAAATDVKSSDRGFRRVEVIPLRGRNLAAGRALSGCSADSLDPCMYDTIAFSPDGKLLAEIVDHWFWLSDMLPKKDIRDGPLAGRSLYRAGGVAWRPDGGTVAVADGRGVLLIRIGDSATVRLREVRVGDKLFGLVDDGHGHFCGDDGAVAPVMKGGQALAAPPLTAPPPGAPPAAPREPPTRQPDLLTQFLASGAR